MTDDWLSESGGRFGDSPKRQSTPNASLRLMILGERYLNYVWREFGRHYNRKRLHEVREHRLWNI